MVGEYFPLRWFQSRQNEIPPLSILVSSFIDDSLLPSVSKIGRQRRENGERTERYT